MRKFQCLLFVLKRSYIRYYIIGMTVPLSYESNKKIKYFLSSMFQYNMIPTINKPTT